MSKRMEAALNKQINAEIFSAYLYMAMEAYFRSVNLKGFANWMRVQALEELTHADRFASYVFDRGARVTLEAVDKPEAAWKTPLEVFEHVLRHERKVTSLIGALVDLAAKEKDHATSAMLQWFVTEQVEEETTAEEIVAQLGMVRDSSHGLLMLDRELGTRVFVPPAPSKG